MKTPATVITRAALLITVGLFSAQCLFAEGFSTGKTGGKNRKNSKNNRGGTSITVQKVGEGFDRRSADEQLDEITPKDQERLRDPYVQYKSRAEYNKILKKVQEDKSEEEILSRLRWQIDIEQKSPNTRAKDGGTWLHHAVRRNYPDVVRMLLKKGADPSLKDHSGRTPADWADMMQLNEIADLLKSKP